MRRHMSMAKRLVMGVMRWDGNLLPYTADFTAMQDGAIPGWVGTTWAVSSGVAVNTPTLAGELLADPGMEGVYTDGLVASLFKQSTPTVADGAPDVHGGSHSQAYTGGAGAQYVYNFRASVAGAWYQYSVWGKRVSGTANNTYVRLYQDAGLPGVSILNRTISATFAQRKINIITPTTGNILYYPAYSTAASDPVIVDDHSLQIITASTLYTLRHFGKADVIVKIQPAAFVDNTMIGLVLRANASASPTGSVEVLAYERYNNPAQMDIAVVKKVAGVYSGVLVATTVAIVADAWLEARATGSTVKIYYNNVQVGGDLTIADGAGNTYHGMVSGGGNQVKSFFAQAS